MRNRVCSGYPLAKAVFLLLIAFIGFCEVAHAADSGKGFETVSVNIGYMSQDDLGARVGVPELTDYIKKLLATCKEFFADATARENLDIVVAVRANQESRVWFVSSMASPEATGARDQLRAKLEAITPPNLSAGPIAFAIQGRIAGGVPRIDQHMDWPPLPREHIYTPDGSPPQPNADAPVHPPIPSDWMDVLLKQGQSLKFDELLPLVWPISSAAPPAPLASASSAPAAADDGLIIPEGIRYKKASPEENERAKQLLLATFTAQASDANVLLLFGSHVICGPGLWPDIKANPAISKITKGTVTLNEGTQKLEGKLFQSPDEVLTFWSAFKQRTDFTGLKIRKLNPDELQTYWAMISFDIEEPIFILESSKHKILVNFTHDGKILRIDDYQNFPPHQ